MRGETPENRLVTSKSNTGIAALGQILPVTNGLERPLSTSTDIVGVRNYFITIILQLYSLKWQKNARTNSSWFLDDGSNGAETSLDVLLVLLRKPMERSSMKVVPGRMDSDLVVVRNIVDLLEHHRHAGLLPLQSWRLRRRTCATTCNIVIHGCSLRIYYILCIIRLGKIREF